MTALAIVRPVAPVRSAQDAKVAAPHRAPFPHQQENDYIAILVARNARMVKELERVLLKAIRAKSAELTARAKETTARKRQRKDTADTDIVGFLGLVRKTERRWGKANPASKQAGKIERIGRGIDAHATGVVEDQVLEIVGVGVEFAHASGQATIDSWVEKNVNLITTVDKRYFKQVEGVVDKFVREGRSVKALTKEIQRRGKVSQSRAKLIARDQTNKLNGQFNEKRQNDLGVAEYEWVTAADERVRESHEEMDGSRQKWAKPPIVDGEAAHPGQPIQCRCYASPVMSEKAIDDLLQGGPAGPPTPLTPSQLARQASLQSRLATKMEDIKGWKAERALPGTDSARKRLLTSRIYRGRKQAEKMRRELAALGGPPKPKPIPVPKPKPKLTPDEVTQLNTLIKAREESIQRWAVARKKAKTQGKKGQITAAIQKAEREIEQLREKLAAGLPKPKVPKVPEGGKVPKPKLPPEEVASLKRMIEERRKAIESLAAARSRATTPKTTKARLTRMIAQRKEEMAEYQIRLTGKIPKWRVNEIAEEIVERATLIRGWEAQLKVAKTPAAKSSLKRKITKANNEILQRAVQIPEKAKTLKVKLPKLPAAAKPGQVGDPVVEGIKTVTLDPKKPEPWWWDIEGREVYVNAKKELHPYGLTKDEYVTARLRQIQAKGIMPTINARADIGIQYGKLSKKLPPKSGKRWVMPEKLGKRPALPKTPRYTPEQAVYRVSKPTEWERTRFARQRGLQLELEGVAVGTEARKLALKEFDEWVTASKKKRLGAKAKPSKYQPGKEGRDQFLELRAEQIEATGLSGKEAYKKAEQEWKGYWRKQDPKKLVHKIMDNDARWYAGKHEKLHGKGDSYDRIREVTKAERKALLKELEGLGSEFVDEFGEIRIVIGRPAPEKTMGGTCYTYERTIVISEEYIGMAVKFPSSNGFPNQILRHEFGHVVDTMRNVTGKHGVGESRINRSWRNLRPWVRKEEVEKRKAAWYQQEVRRRFRNKDFTLTNSDLFQMSQKYSAKDIEAELKKAVRKKAKAAGMSAKQASEAADLVAKEARVFTRNAKKGLSKKATWSETEAYKRDLRVKLRVKKSGGDNNWFIDLDHKGSNYFTRDYAMYDPGEDFAEAFMEWSRRPKHFRKMDPEYADWMDREFGTDVKTVVQKFYQ